MNHASKIALFAGALFVVTGCSDDADDVNQNIVEVAAEAGTFQTLLTAADAAGLVEALEGDGPLTVFAPNDEAFAELPEGTVEALLNDTEQLAAILTYHVVGDELLASDVVALESVQTLNGRALTITSDSGVRVDGANVIATDIMASNGVIHVIDSVLIPE